MNATYDIVCLSHLRWDFVHQRPHHLLTRFARDHRVYFVEEPLYGPGPIRLEVGMRRHGVQVVTPHLPEGVSARGATAAQALLIEGLLHQNESNDYILWYYTPMAREFTAHLRPLATVYDCMDELSTFLGAPPTMLSHEQELLDRVDVVFTGGQSIYEAKKDRHPNIHALPSSVDVEHFARARALTHDPADQAPIPHPRLGYFGVIDERIDLGLLDALAASRPGWQFVMVGPVVKISADTLPRRENIHYLGGKNYQDLPAYIAGWDVAMMPFARNEATRFISPTKTPEYLAAGKPVVSTSIRDVVRPYGERGLVRIADTARAFAVAAEAAMREDAGARVRQADAFLSLNSWERTWARMARLVDTTVAARAVPSLRSPVLLAGNEPLLASGD